MDRAKIRIDWRRTQVGGTQRDRLLGRQTDRQLGKKIRRLRKVGRHNRQKQTDRERQLGRQTKTNS